MVLKVHFSGRFSYMRDLSGNTNTLRPAGLHQPDWAGFPQPGQVHFPEPSAIHGPPPQGPHQSPCGSCLQPQIQSKQTALTGASGSREGRRLSPFPYGEYQQRETGRWPKCLDTMGLWAQLLLDSGNLRLEAARGRNTSWVTGRSPS